MGFNLRLIFILAYFDCFHAYCLTRGIWHMNLAPKGSKYEKRNKEILSDPINKLPWDFQFPFIDDLPKESPANLWYHFLKGEWTYLNHKQDCPPGGLIEGGPQNYQGFGLKLPHGKDRQRLKKYPRYLDHGVEWRRTMKRKIMNSDIDPDGCQDYIFGETDEDLENRQWGSWNNERGYNSRTPETGWKDMHSGYDLSEMPHDAWTHKVDDVKIMPNYIKMPPVGPVSPPLAWKLAAGGLFGGWMSNHEWTRNDMYREQFKILKELEEEDDIINSSVLSGRNDTKRTHKFWKTLGNIKKGEASGAQDLRVAILNRTRRMMTLKMHDIRDHPDFLEYILDRDEMYDHLIHGKSNCTKSEIQGKTITVNLSIYSVKEASNTYEEKMTPDEMAEMYHYTMSELKRTGRHIDHNVVTPDSSHPYLYESERKNFKFLESIFRPVRMNRKYGEEFGGSLRKKERIKMSTITQFGKKLRENPITRRNNSTNNGGENG